MANHTKIVDEATFAPKKIVNSKYALTEVNPDFVSKLKAVGECVCEIPADEVKDMPGVILAPYIMCDYTEESLKEYNDFMSAYRDRHRCCPNCGSRNYTMTLAGFPFNHDKPDEYKDRNSCHCLDCGWKGIVHELVPEKDKEENA